jgi:hypothetical protein
VTNALCSSLGDELNNSSCPMIDVNRSRRRAP